MELINQQFLERLDLLRNGPILYRGDPAAARTVSEELKEYAALGLPEALLRATADTFVQSHVFDNSNLAAEYKRAYSQLRVAVEQSPSLARYKEAPSKVLLEHLVGQFIDLAPRHTILAVAGLTDHIDLETWKEFKPLTAAEVESLYDSAGKLMAVDRDVLEAQAAVQQTIEIISSVDSFLVAMTLVIAFTPEGFSLPSPNRQQYEYDRTLTGMVFSGLKNFPKPDVTMGSYAIWWAQLFEYVSRSAPKYGPLLWAVFPRPTEQVIDDLIPEEMKFMVELCGEAFAALCTVYTSESIQQMILPRLAHMYLTALVPDKRPLDQPFKNWAWGVLPKVAQSCQGVLEQVARWIFVTRKYAETWAVPATVLSPLIGLFYTTGVALYELIDKIIEVFVYGMDKFAHPFITWLREYLYLGRAWASAVLPGARRRPKSVWALLFVNDFTRLDPGTRFALSCAVMQHTPAPTFHDWEARFKKDINDTGLADFQLFEAPSLRPLRLPKEPITIDREILALAPLFPGAVRETDIMDEKMAKWVQYNVPQGIDGQWFATPERVAASIRRYQVERTEPNSYTVDLVREGAHALVNKYPEMYEDHRYFTLAHAMRRLKWDTNFSPGLGFLGNVRTRKMLRKHGFLAAIQDVATKRLMEGIHPGSPAHVFVKEQVVNLESLLKGKNIRTVTAMNLMSNTLALPFSIELSRAPPPEAYVLNALPRSEGGYRPFFEDLKKHALVLQADASQFDSALAPVLTVEGLAELRSIGFKNNPALDIIKTQIYEHYYQMRHGALVDLTTGTVFSKTGGLMTGQVNTSYDNRDAFRLMIITAWAHITGEPCEDFWVKNTLGNAGDDDVIGSDYPRETWIKIFDACKDLFGVVVNLEQEGWDDLSITALQPTPEMLDTAYYRAQLGMPVVDYGIRTEPAKLLLSKTEFRARHSRLSDIPFRLAHIDTMVGTAYLTAYNPEIYEDLADLYKADFNHVMLRFFESVEMVEQRDKFGNLSNLEIIPGKIRQRYEIQEKRIRTMMADVLKKARWPSYQRVFNIWVRPYSAERSSIVKHYKTLISGGPALPVAYKLLYGLVGFRESLYTIPNHVVRALPEFPGADVSVTLKTPEFIIERFVWRSLFHKMKAVPTKQAFLNALREGPYASACSPNDFLEFIETEQYMAELINTDLELLRAQAVLMTVVYTFLEKILNVAAQTPLLGILVSLYALATRDVNRLYSVANHFYWLAEGRSSSVISNLMPADPYAWMKQVSVIIVTGVPARYIAVPGLRHLVTWVPSMVEAWTLASATVAPNVGRLTFASPPSNSPWSRVIDQILDVAADDRPFSATIVAPTGSGKSTLFVALLNVIMPVRRIWLLHPTVAARDEYCNDFLPQGFVQILARGIDPIRPDTRVVSVTAGYFTQIISSVLDTDIIILDEVHLSTTEMWVAWWLTHGQIRFAMTATPNFTIQPKTDHVFNYPGQRRFRMKMTYVNQTFEQLFTELANRRPALLTRALIICPTLTVVNYVVNTLARLSYPSSILSSDYPVPARSGIIVATSIADQALTIDPPPSTVIDLGTMLKISVTSRLGNLIPEHEVKIVPVSQEVADQRAGRGGRSSDSEGFGLLNAPRSKHEAPARFPPAVWLHDQVADSVMVSLGLRNVLTPRRTVPGVLQFVDLVDGIQGFQNPHSVALAAILLLYLSAGAQYDVFETDFYNWKYVDNQTDALRVYSSQSQHLFPDLQPLLGSPSSARELLETGIFECQVGFRTFPVAAFLFIDGWLCPVGHDPIALFQGGATRLWPSTLAPVIHRGLDEVNWRNTLTNYRINGVVNPQPIVYAQPLQMVTWGQMGYIHDSSVPAFAMMLINRTRRLVDSSRRVANVLNLVSDVAHAVHGFTTLVLSPNGAVHPVRGVLSLDVSDVGIVLVQMMPFAMLIAAALHDDQILIVGQVPEFLPRTVMFRTNRCLVYGPPDDVRTVIVSPLTARRVVPILANICQMDSSRILLSMLPFVVMDSHDDFNAWLALPAQVALGTILGSKLVLN